MKFHYLGYFFYLFNLKIRFIHKLALTFKPSLSDMSHSIDLYIFSPTKNARFFHLLSQALSLLYIIYLFDFCNFNSSLFCFLIFFLYSSFSVHIKFYLIYGFQKILCLFYKCLSTSKKL